MAVGEPRQVARNGGIISQVSWTDGTTQDVYYWMDHSFQYSANINTDDELHGIKLATYSFHTSNYAKCQLVSLWEHWVMALPLDVDWDDDRALRRFQCNWNTDTPTWEEFDSEAGTVLSSKYNSVPWVVFQNQFWFWANIISGAKLNKGYLHSVPLAINAPQHWVDFQAIYLPYDHNDYTDESIEDANDITQDHMQWNITAILNYNNTRLVVACGNEVWVYYPELDHAARWSENYLWVQWWKRVLNYEAWVTVVALTCTFEYLKVRAVDEGWNTKVYYYQGNNNLRSTFVYNVVDLTGVRVLHVYPINWVDYYTSSIWEYASDALIDFNKMIGATPVKLFHQRAWLIDLDINNKAPYFVWPTSISWAYNNWNIYVADAYWVFSFKYNPEWFDKGYMKWKLRDIIESWKQVYWLCENKGFLYVSDTDWCRAMRLYDTGVDGYQPRWVLISREFEWKEWGTYTKMLDEVRMNFELNPLTNFNGEIDVYVSPNNLRKNTHTFTEANNWYHAMHIDQKNAWTRTEKSNLFNDLWWTISNKKSSFKFDWQTITYAIVITRYTAPNNPTAAQTKAECATPIVRMLDIRYHSKDKINNVYDIN